MWLKKASGGASIGQYSWAKPGDVIEIPDALGEQLLAIPGHDFTVVDPPAVKQPERTETADASPAEGKSAASSSARTRGKTVKE